MEEAQEKELVRQFFAGKTEGCFVEVGANEPTSELSQTWHLEQIGWHGVLVEPIEELYRLCVSKRPRSRSYQVACSSADKAGTMEIFIPVVDDQEVAGFASLDAGVDGERYASYHRREVQVVTLQSLLEGSGIGAIDLLTIDTEGTELDVLRGIDLSKYRPALILIEDKLVYLQKHFYLRRNGYRLMRRTGFNNWYVPRESLAPGPPATERLRLFRKLYLGLLPRKIKHAIKQRSPAPLLSV